MPFQTAAMPRPMAGSTPGDFFFAGVRARVDELDRAGGFLLPDDRGAELREALLRDRGGEDARVAMAPP